MLISAQWAAEKYCWIAIRILRGIYLSVCLRKIRSSNGVRGFETGVWNSRLRFESRSRLFFQYLLVFRVCLMRYLKKDLEFWHEIKSSRFSEKLSAKWAEVNFDLFRHLLTWVKWSDSAPSVEYALQCWISANWNWK